LANITKPVDINKIWSATGDILAPPDTKISSGWQIEIPPRQYFNYIDNKQDQAIAHINQHGVAIWDTVTEYQANLSYTQGTNGTIYKCLKTNTNVNPIGDTTASWRVAFLDSSATVGPVVATAAQSRAMTDNSVFISPAQLANAFTGTNQSLVATGFQLLPGGMVMQWASSLTIVPTDIGATADAAVTFAKPMSTILSLQLTHGLGNSGEASEMTYSVIAQSGTGATARFRRISGTQSGTETVKADFLAIGLLA